MATAANLTTAMARPQVGLQELIKKATGELRMALPSHLNPERLVRIALTAIRLNPKLAQCTAESFLGSLFMLAQIGLEPIAGRAYLLPFNNSRKIVNANGKEEWRSVLEVQAIIGYKGLIDLFYRHESALSIDMQVVHENDNFSYEYGTNSYLTHKPTLEDRGKPIGYYAVAKMKGGGVVFRFMSKLDALEHGKKHSKTYDKSKNTFHASSPWMTDPDAMSMKTVLIQLAKLLPLSVELQQAIQADETSRDYRTGIDNVLDLPSTTTWADAPDETKTDNIPAMIEEAIPEIWKDAPANLLAEARVNLKLSAMTYQAISENPKENKKMTDEVNRLFDLAAV